MYISSRFKIILSAYFCACIGFFVLCTAHWKQVNDPAQLSYLCFLMDHGMAPYRDLLEINMPGIYLVNWSVMHMLGEGSFAWRIFDLAGQRRRREWAIFAFGVCAGMAATIKPTPLPFVFLLLVLAAIRCRQTGQPIMRPLLYALLGLLVPFALVCAFLVSKHSVGSFWYLLRVELPFYKSLGRLPFPTLMTLIASTSTRALALIALATALFKRRGWDWESKLLVAGIAFGIASFFGQGKGFPYHRYPMLAFLFLWVGLQIVTGLRARGMVGILAATGFAFALVLLPLYVREASRKVWDPQFINSLSADLNHLGGRELSGHVQCIYMPADCDNTLYQMRLVQSTGLFYDYLIFGSSRQQVIRDARQQFWQQLKRTLLGW